jgi:MFS family permease
MSNTALTRSARMYSIYAPLTQAHFWLPIFFLYFNQHMSLDHVLRLEAIYYVAVVILEVPSGYLSDTLGRRLTLIISSISALIAYALFLLGDSFIIFSLAQISLAAGMAFRSGTDTSFHHDILQSLNREQEYGDREARITRNTFLVSAGAALIGGIVSIYALKVAYALSLVVACVAIALTFTFSEPNREKPPKSNGFLPQIWACFAYLRHPTLGWLMLFSVFMIVINHIPYEFYQPYIQLLEGQHTAPTPLLTGFHTALTMVIAAWFANYSIRLSNRLGTRPALMFGACIQSILILLMSLFLHPLVALLLSFRSAPRALMVAPFNAATVPHLQQHHRATYLSIQSLMGRLAFSASLMLLATFTGTAPNWPTLSHTLHISTTFAIIGSVLLAITALVIPRSRWQLTSEQ